MNVCYKQYRLNIQKSKGKKVEIQSLTTNNREVDQPNEIDKIVEEFYKKLYEKGDSKSNNKGALTTFLQNLEKPSITNIADISNLLTLQDLRNTINSCKDSSPGPDGIPYSLIKLTWSWFGPILLDSWKYASKTGNLTHSHENYHDLPMSNGLHERQTNNR